LTHEVASSLSLRGIGQSTCVCIGGDAAKGFDFVDLLKLFRDDPQTVHVIMIGEIGGAAEECAARFIDQSGYPKPVTAFIAGANAPQEKRMGHAGAIVSGGFGTVESKKQTLSAAGVCVTDNLEDIYTRAEKLITSNPE
jgi:succinyl-CoA synthetase alpha subunit